MITYITVGGILGTLARYLVQGALPLIIEIVETEETIQSILPDLDEMIGGGLVTLERARVILYRPANARSSQQELHRIEGLEPE